MHVTLPHRESLSTKHCYPSVRLSVTLLGLPTIFVTSCQMQEILQSRGQTIAQKTNSIKSQNVLSRSSAKPANGAVPETRLSSKISGPAHILTQLKMLLVDRCFHYLSLYKYTLVSTS